MTLENILHLGFLQFSSADLRISNSSATCRSSSSMLFVWLQKLNRRMHLSKVKHSKFNESGQLAIFYAASAAWGIDLIIRVCYAYDISFAELSNRAVESAH